MSTRFVPDHRFEPGLRAQPAYQRGMAKVARHTAVFVRAAAEPSRKTGAFVRSIKVEGNAIVSTDAFWHLVELGSINNPPYAPFRNGVIAAGLRFVDLYGPQ